MSNRGPPAPGDPSSQPHEFTEATAIRPLFESDCVQGPPEDPAEIAGTTDVIEGLQRIAGAGALLASRGDDSGTHKAEMRLWQAGGIDAQAASGDWYRETGSGMGATLNVGIAIGAYVLTDRATWIAFRNRQSHRIVVEGDPRLFNQYGIIQVNPGRHPHVNAGPAKAFVDWVISAEGQAAIASYRVEGQQLFFPNAGK